MAETDVLFCLVGLLQDEHTYVQQSSTEAIIAMAKFSRVIYHFVLYED
jgi:hypothetical protein